MSLLIFFIALVVFLASKPLLIPRVRSYKTAEQIHTLLNPQHTSLAQLLVARATPNQRLVDAFGLTNTFVSDDIKIHKTFTSMAKMLITGVGEKSNRWRALAIGTETANAKFLQVQRSVEFATLIQCTTFSIILHTMFGADLDTMHHDDVVYVTDSINRRWKESKTKNSVAMQDDSLRTMVTHINRWIADRDRYPNPLNFILPAYETMWRVVAVVVAYVYRRRDNMLHVAIAFGRDPTEERFQEFAEDGLPSMQAIVLEVLRLHPPTRHIARTPISGSWWTFPVPAVEIADIEAVHLSDDYGENASEFDPTRFHPSRGLRPELLSFGYGKLKCVAAAWAPMAAAVISASTILQLEEARCKVTVGPEIGGRSGWDGWSVRSD